MMKILKSIGDFYKYIAGSMGGLFYLFLSVMSFFVFFGIKDYVNYGETLILSITGVLLFIYHVIFFFDRKKKMKK